MELEEICTLQQQSSTCKANKSTTKNSNKTKTKNLTKKNKFKSKKSDPFNFTKKVLDKMTPEQLCSLQSLSKVENFISK